MSLTMHRVTQFVGGLFLALAMALVMAVPSFAQANLATGAKDAATDAVAGGAAVALVILAAVILYRIIKRFAS